MSPPQITIQKAGPSDLSAVADLLRHRDQRDHDIQSVRRYLLDLDPDRLRAWIANVDGRPGGLTALYIRNLLWDDGETIKAGYWAHLYVQPQYRKLMLYPQLVFAMLTSAKPAGLDLIYTGTRRRQVAEAHVQLGFHRVGRLPVLIKPLSPARLISKHKDWPGATRLLAAPIDALFRGYVAARRPGCPANLSAEELKLTSEDVETLVQMANARGKDRISQLWTADDLRRRFAGTIEGGPYTVLVARSAGALTAALIFRLAERGNGIRVSVIMDVVCSPSAASAARSLLGEAERRADHDHCEAMLYLDGAGPTMRELVAKLGYRNSPEAYDILVWPKEKVPPRSAAAEISRWRFTFADHDAF